MCCAAGSNMEHVIASLYVSSVIAATHHRTVKDMGWRPWHPANRPVHAYDKEGDLPDDEPVPHPLHEPLGQFLARLPENVASLTIITRKLPWNYQLPAHLRGLQKLSTWMVCTLIPGLLFLF